MMLPYTGKEFLKSLDDGREVWIYGERVKNITTHPAFQNCARMLARLYFFPRTGFLPRALIHGCTRLAVKLDFITGLLIKATEITGSRSFRGVEANIREVIAWRNMIWGLSDAMAKSADPWTGGCLLSPHEPARGAQGLAAAGPRHIKKPTTE